MKLNLRVLVLASVIFAAAFTTYSSATEAKAEDDERQLSSILPVLGPLLGLFIGLNLGRGFGRIGRGRRRCGRDLDDDNNPLDKIERHLIRDTMRS